MSTWSKEVLSILGIVGIIALAIILIAMPKGKPQQQKNRVPTLADYAAQAQQAAKDAQTAADQAAKTQKDIQAAVDKLNSVQHDSSGEPKEGRPEVTQPGVVTDFGAFKVDSSVNTSSSDSNDFYLGFTFTDRYGFTKRFFPVCPNETVRTTGVPITIMYHWRTWQGTSVGKLGCYQIDGFQNQ